MKGKLFFTTTYSMAFNYCYEEDMGWVHFWEYFHDGTFDRNMNTLRDDQIIKNYFVHIPNYFNQLYGLRREKFYL